MKCVGCHKLDAVYGAVLCGGCYAKESDHHRGIPYSVVDKSDSVSNLGGGATPMGCGPDDFGGTDEGSHYMNTLQGRHTLLAAGDEIKPGEFIAGGTTVVLPDGRVGVLVKK